VLERRIFVALIALQIVLVWSMPSLVGHDLPQHLAYVRILAGIDRPEVGSVYHAGTDFYATTHWLLAYLARLTSVDVAIRIVYSAYALAVPLAFRSLARAVDRRTGANALLGLVVVWNPIVCMGFLPFTMALPLFLFGIASALRYARFGRARDFAGAIAMTLGIAFVHVLALAFFLVFTSLLGLRRQRRAFGLSVACGMIGLAFVRATASSGAVDPGFAWSSWGEKGNVVLATIFGPFPHAVRAFTAAIVLVAAIVIGTRPRGGTPSDDHRRAFARAAIAFALLCLVVPTSIRAPEDCCLIDFRMYTFAFAALLALVPARWFALRVARRTLAATVAIVLAVWARQWLGAADEANDVVALVSKLGPGDRLLALCFEDASAFFDESNGMLHYLAVHHTVRNGGITSLFWGRSSPHLPVGYRPAREPPHPPDWDPGRVSEAHVRAATHVLVTWPDPIERSKTRLRERLGADEIECRGRTCLYEIRRR
jgi:hypothetical protein